MTSHSAIDGPSIVSVVAKSNTGKTTLIETLVPEVQKRGLSVGVVKHHTHLSSFDVPGKDTYRMAQAGADLVMGISPVQIAVFRNQDGFGDYREVILEHCSGLDLVLTEGFKLGPFPKIEVHRSARSTELICTPHELLALVSDRSWDLPVRRFALGDAAGLATFLSRWVADGAAWTNQNPT